jgi:hypothetical protein
LFRISSFEIPVYLGYVTVPQKYQKAWCLAAGGDDLIFKIILWLTYLFKILLAPSTIGAKF